MEVEVVEVGQVLGQFCGMPGIVGVGLLTVVLGQLTCAVAVSV